MVPRSLRRRAIEVAGWLELGCPRRALDKVEPLLATPGARPFGLKLKASAAIQLEEFATALEALDELGPFEDDHAWLDLTEAWCRKRTDDLPAAIHCMERLIRRDPKSAIGHYNLGCYLALQGDTGRALDCVTRACGLDRNFREMLEGEDDLDALRDDPEFRKLMPRRESS